MCYVIDYFCVTLFLTIYLQGALQLTAFQASLLMIPLSAPQLIFGPLAGKLGDYFGEKKAIVSGVFLLNVALIMLGNLKDQLSIFE